MCGDTSLILVMTIKTAGWSHISPALSVRPRQFLGAPPREGAAVQVPARRGASLISVKADAVDPPAASAGGSEGGEGLADPVVLRFLEVVGQDSFLVLQLLEKESTDHETRG